MATKLSKTGAAALAAALALALALAFWRLRPAEGFSVSGVFDVVPTREDLELQKAFAVVSVPRKGLGVVATRDVPAWTFVAPYPGMVYDPKSYDEHKRRGDVTDEYALEFWNSPPGARIDSDWIINPVFDGSMPPEYAKSVAPYINEPAKGQTPNTVWVWNFPRHRIELWTSRRVRAGEELGICYGPVYGRSYKTPCTDPKNEPGRYVIVDATQTRPRQWADLMDSDVVPLTEPVRP